MKPSKIPAALCALALITIAVAVAACSGKGSCKNCGAQTGLTNCQIDWAHTGSVTGRFDVYLVDMPVKDWTSSGTKTYSFDPADQVSAIFYKNLLVPTSGPQTYESRGITTAGTFTVTVAGTALGSSVSLSDAGGHKYWAINGADQIGVYLGSGGAGGFDGTWSDPAAPQPGAGTNVMAITYQGTSLTLGVPNYAVCYSKGSTSFAPEGPALPVGFRPH